MYESLLELGGEALAVVAYAVGTVALSALGIVAEYNGLQEFLGGHPLLAAWFAFMGIVALGFAANLGRERLLPRISTET